MTERRYRAPAYTEGERDEPKSSIPEQLLSSLSAADFELLRPHLQRAELIHEAVLARAADTVARVYFPHSGVISLVLSMAGGEVIEVATDGRGSVFGTAAALDGRTELNDAIVQLPGDASTLDVRHLRAAAAQSVSFRAALIRHAEFVLVPAQQWAACNATHTPLAVAGARPLRQRHLAADAGILGADARRAAQQRIARRQYLNAAGLIR